MKTIYLQGDKYDPSWIPFSFNSLFELKDEFETREIIIGEGVSIGDDSYLANSVYIGDYSRIGRGVHLKKGVQIGSTSDISNFVEIGEAVSVCRACKVGECSLIGFGSTINSDSKIGDSCIIPSRSYIGMSANIPDSTKVKPIRIDGTKDSVLYWGEDIIEIGCQRHSISKWLEFGEMIAHAHGYKGLIDEYRIYVEMIAKIHQINLDRQK